MLYLSLFDVIRLISLGCLFRSIFAIFLGSIIHLFIVIRHQSYFFGLLVSFLLILRYFVVLGLDLLGLLFYGNFECFG